MKLVDLTCSKCGAKLQVNAELGRVNCQYCGNEMLIDDEVIHHQVDNAYQAGYQMEMGRQAAVYDAQRMQQEAYFYAQKQQSDELEKQKKNRLKLRCLLILLILVVGILWWKTSNFVLFIIDAVLVGILLFLIKRNNNIQY